jgi:hypothetical protein
MNENLSIQSHGKNRFRDFDVDKADRARLNGRADVACPDGMLSVYPTLTIVQG